MDGWFRSSLGGLTQLLWLMMGQKMRLVRLPRRLVPKWSTCRLLREKGLLCAVVGMRPHDLARLRFFCSMAMGSTPQVMPLVSSAIKNPPVLIW